MTDTATPPTDTAPPRPFADTDDARTQAMEANMIAKGEPTTEPVEVDYFAFAEEHRVMLPDGVQWVDHKELNEGDRRQYMKATNRDVKLQRATGDAYLRMAAGEDRAALLKAAIVGWNIKRNGKALLFSKTAVDDVLNAFPPKIIDLIHRDILKHNTWLMAEATVEDIDREIEALQEQRIQLIETQAGKDGS
jgi:hypothetical protein